MLHKISISMEKVVADYVESKLTVVLSSDQPYPTVAPMPIRMKYQIFLSRACSIGKSIASSLVVEFGSLPVFFDMYL